MLNPGVPDVKTERTVTEPPPATFILPLTAFIYPTHPAGLWARCEHFCPLPSPVAPDVVLNSVVMKAHPQKEKKKKKRDGGF